MKRVAIKPQSKLAEILQTTRLRVNALHNQAVQKPGQGIDIVAKEPNQIVQAIESVTEKFVIGVQWHPEYLIQKKIHRRIFKALIKAAQEHAVEKLNTVNN